VVLLALMVLQMCHAGGIAGSGGVTNVSFGRRCWLLWCYTCVIRVELLALVVLQMFNAGGVAGSGGARIVPRGWRCWLWQSYKCVARVALLAIAELQMCNTGGVAGSSGVTNVPRGWRCWLWWCYKRVTRVVLLALAVLQMVHACRFEQVPLGLEIGMEGMKVGGLRRIEIPPNLGYESIAKFNSLYTRCINCDSLHKIKHSHCAKKYAI
jgi:hypothetical protein